MSVNTLPTPLTSRTFAGSAVSIDIPLDGLDPDGDSVMLTGISSAPNLGRVAERTSTSITYEAFAGSTGTDQAAARTGACPAYRGARVYCSVMSTRSRVSSSSSMAVMESSGGSSGISSISSSVIAC